MNNCTRYLTALLICTFLGTAANAQTIVSAGPSLVHDLGNEISLTCVLTGAATSGNPFTLRKGNRTLAGSHSYQALNTYWVNFHTWETDAPGNWTLYYNSSPYATPLVLNAPSYPGAMTFMDAFTWSAGQALSGELLRDLVVDNSGNMYVCGQFGSTLNIPPLTRNGVGNTDAYVAKLSPTGSAIWVHTLTGGHADHITDIELYQDSILFITGDAYFNWNNVPVKYDNDTLPPPPETGYGEGLLMRLNAAGDLQWHALLGGYGGGSFGSALVKGPDRLVVAGTVGYYFNNIARFYSAGMVDSIEVSMAVGQGYFAGEYGMDGTLHWVRMANSSTASRVRLLHLQDDVLALANSDYDINYDSTSCTTSCCNEKIFMMRLDSTGERLWCFEYGNVHPVPWMDTDSAGNIYLMPASNEWNTDRKDLLKMDANGVQTWAVELEHSMSFYSEDPQCALHLPNGSIMVAYAERMFDYYCNSTQLVLKRTDAVGAVQSTLWPVVSSYCGAGQPLCMAWDPTTQTVLVAGHLEHSANFGPDALITPANVNTLFIARVDDDALMSRPEPRPEPSGLAVMMDGSTVTISAPGLSSLRIHDAMGRLVATQQFSGERLTLNMEDQADGIYVAIDPVSRRYVRFCVAR
ncbi:MAG: hypothetical protein WAU70_12490 [Flavobacteriales bacterium]